MSKQNETLGVPQYIVNLLIACWLIVGADQAGGVIWQLVVLIVKMVKYYFI